MGRPELSGMRLVFCLVPIFAAPSAQFIWTSERQTSLPGTLTMTKICSSEVPGASVFICTDDVSIRGYLTEKNDIYIRTGYEKWSLAAHNGSVFKTLFENKGFGSTITTWKGGSPGGDPIVTGCYNNGSSIPKFNCGGDWANDGVLGYGTANSHWLELNISNCSGFRPRFYCMSSTLPPTSVGAQKPPTPRPTRGEVCSTCVQVISADFVDSPTPAPNSSLLIGDPRNPLSLTVTTLAVPDCTVNCSVLITVVPASEGPPLFGTGGTSILSLEVFDGTRPRGSTELLIPVIFEIPYSADLVGCPNPIKTSCVWWNGEAWVTSGCEAVALSTGTRCTCTHFTDFAVLLDQSLPHPCSKPNEVSEIYYVFIVLYGLLLSYCVVAVLALCRARSAQQTHNPLIIQHFLVGSVSCLRILSCLAYLHVFGQSLVLTAFVAAAPYPLEYALFTKLASTWAGLVHFSMLTGDARWTKIRPFFYAINILGTCFALALFVLFVVESSFESAAAGTCVLCAFYLALAIAFNVYAGKILKELDKVGGASSKSGGSSSSSSTVKKSGVGIKIRWVGRVATACFVAQAICSIVGLLVPEQLAGWTAAFLLFNVLALVCLLVAYHAAVKKVASKKDASNVVEKDSSSRPGMSARNGTDLTELQQRGDSAQ